MGLLIGRDGINRKRLQQSTGATLYLRGRGTELRGQTKLSEQVDKRGRLTEAGEAMEEMHVLLEADTDEQIEAARVQVRAQHPNPTPNPSPSPSPSPSPNPNPNSNPSR